MDRGKYMCTYGTQFYTLNSSLTYKMDDYLISHSLPKLHIGMKIQIYMHMDWGMLCFADNT